MHSGVFGTTPEATAEIIARYLRDRDPSCLRRVEILDIESEAGLGGLRPSRVSVALVPNVSSRLQQAKGISAPGDEKALEELCAQIADEMEAGRYYVLGPGTTTDRVMKRLSLTSSLNGVDVVRDRELVAADVSEAGLLETLSGGDAATLILGVIGGQGFLLGRGNQQISGAVVRRIGEENVKIVSSEEKLLALNPSVLRVDVGIEKADTIIHGYRRVLTAPRKSMVMRVGA
jgi:predicted polyphosphate/ATP-dependent NAD kinase